MTLIIMMDKLISALKKGKLVLCLFLDVSKAFDTVNHGILFNKCLFKSYLTNRYQYVEYNNEKSSKWSGGPSRFILLPSLFLSHKNVLPKVSNKVFPLLFADDSNIFIEGNNILTMQNELNMEMIKVSSWLKANNGSEISTKLTTCYWKVKGK